jgi:hypothetical protein
MLYELQLKLEKNRIFDLQDIENFALAFFDQKATKPR